MKGLTAKLILKDIAASTKRFCTAFVCNSQGSNGVQNIISKLFKHYKLLTKGRSAVRYAKQGFSGKAHQYARKVHGAADAVA